MMDEQRTRLEVMVEDLQGQVKMVAESNQAVAAALADMRADFTRRFDELDVRFVGMQIEMRDLKAEVGTLGGKVDNLEAFAKEAGPRLERVEVFASEAGPRLERLEGKVDNLEVFASEAGPRLERIETHFALPVLPPRRETTSVTPSKHHRRKPTKRT